MSLVNFENIFSSKSPADVEEIFHLFLLEQIDQVEILYYVIFIVLVNYLTKKMKLKIAIDEKILVLTAIFSFVGYQIGLLGMYLFTMPGVEATDLACYNRYYMTIVMFIIGITLLYFIEIVNALQINRKRIFTVIATSGIIILCAIFIKSSELSLKDFEKKDIQDTWRVQFETIISDYNIPSNKSYLISVDDMRSGFFKHLGRYCLMSKNVIVIAPTGEDSFEDMSSYDYLIILEENEAAKDYVKSNFSDDADEKVIDLAK
jgi:hypothetical protein